MLYTVENYSELSTKQHSSTSLLNKEQIFKSIVNMYKETKEAADGWQAGPTAFSVDDYMTYAE